MNKSTLFVALLFASSAWAGEHAGASFDDLDQNQDGLVSAEEASGNPRLSDQWSKIDGDASGGIDKAEFSAFEMMDESAEEADAE